MRGINTHLYENAMRDAALIMGREKRCPEQRGEMRYYGANATGALK